jgi:hypothetical protein
LSGEVIIGAKTLQRGDWNLILKMMK